MPTFDVMFTGHRPPRLGGWDEANLTAAAVKAWLRLAVSEEVSGGARSFVSGAALGTDQWGAEAVLGAMAASPDVRLCLAIPCDGYDGRWPRESRDRLAAIRAKASEAVVVCPGPYAAYKNLVRDQWMVDRSRRVLAVYDGSPDGGTAHTIRMALKAGLDVRRFNPATKKEEPL